MNKYLVLCGLGSRRSCDRLIAEGHIVVNGEVVQELATQVEEGDTVLADGVPVSPRSDFLYIVMNKPKGVICTKKDPARRNTIYKNLPMAHRLNSVGRLDKDTTGVILLTDDGQLIEHLTHPRYSVPRVYRVTVDHHITPEAVRKISRGVTIDNRLIKAEIRIPDSSNPGKAQITLREGFKHEVKRIFASVNYTVTELHRVSYGGITVSGLDTGSWRYLKKDEIAKLRKAASGIQKSIGT